MTWVFDMKLHSTISIFFLVSVSPVLRAGDAPVRPELWDEYFRDSAASRWSKLLQDDGRVSASEAIEASYELGSHHDGDRQFRTALLIATMNDDPIPTLQKMMKEVDPHRRAFAVMVSGLIADIRLKEDIDRLATDNNILGDAPGGWFWDTVGDAAKMSSSCYQSGGIFEKKEDIAVFPSPAWRKPFVPK